MEWMEAYIIIYMYMYTYVVQSGMHIHSHEVTDIQIHFPAFIFMLLDLSPSIHTRLPKSNSCINTLLHFIMHLYSCTYIICHTHSLSYSFNFVTDHAPAFIIGPRPSSSVLVVHRVLSRPHTDRNGHTPTHAAIYSWIFGPIVAQIGSFPPPEAT